MCGGLSKCGEAIMRQTCVKTEIQLSKFKDLISFIEGFVTRAAFRREGRRELEGAVQNRMILQGEVGKVTFPQEKSEGLTMQMTSGVGSTRSRLRSFRCIRGRGRICSYK